MAVTITVTSLKKNLWKDTLHCQVMLLPSPVETLRLDGIRAQSTPSFQKVKKVVPPRGRSPCTKPFPWRSVRGRNWEQTEEAPACLTGDVRPGPGGGKRGCGGVSGKTCGDSEVYELRTPAADSSPYDAVTHSRGSSCVRAMMSRGRPPPHQVVCLSPHGALCLRHARGRLCGGQGAPHLRSERDGIVRVKREGVALLRRW
ncbi:unnamed protein product [Boreogadus saida]